MSENRVTARQQGSDEWSQAPRHTQPLGWPTPVPQHMSAPPCIQKPLFVANLKNRPDHGRKCKHPKEAKLDVTGTA